MFIYIYIYIYIIYADWSFWRGSNLEDRWVRGGSNHPQMRLYFKGQGIKTSSLNSVKLCASNYYIERSQGEGKKLLRIEEKVMLIILEILWKYYGIESKEGMETLRIIFRMFLYCLIFCCLSLDILWYFKTNYNID